MKRQIMYHFIFWNKIFLVLLLSTPVAIGVQGTITTVAGTGVLGFSGDGGLATEAQLNRPSGIFVDATGNLFIVDKRNHRIRHVDSQTGIITTVAGTGVLGFSGDGGLATEAQLNGPNDIFVDTAGDLFIADTFNHRVRYVDSQTGIITTIAGTGVEDFSGDEGPAIEATFTRPFDVFVDGAGNLFIADIGNHRIRRVDSQTSIITTVAGTREAIGALDGIPATQTILTSPGSIFVDGTGNLFIADRANRRIRRVDSQTGIITTITGTGTEGFSGDGGLATEANIGLASSIFIDAEGNLFLADQARNRVRYVDSQTGIITTVAGTGGFEFSGDGGLATEAKVWSPEGLFVDKNGDLLIADTRNHRIRRVEGIATPTTLNIGAFNPSDEQPTRIIGDITGDGEVNIFDLVAVASQFGQSGENLTSDVNSDGVVNLFDLVEVASHFGEEAMAAPTMFAANPALNLTLTSYRRIYNALSELETTKNPPLGVKIAIDFLRSLLNPKTVITEAKLFANYPNPFNPETWIPYQLAAEATVEISIYNVDGYHIRTLQLGLQPHGEYITKDKAAYWDGRNDVGEHVASGTYFYHFQAGEYSATRKMIILK